MKTTVTDFRPSDYAQFNFSDAVRPISLSSDFGTRSCTHTDTASYVDGNLHWIVRPLQSRFIWRILAPGRCRNKSEKKIKFAKTKYSLFKFYPSHGMYPWPVYMIVLST